MNIADVQDIADKFWQGRQLPQQKELFLQKRVTFWSQLRYATNGSAEIGQIALKLMNCPTSEASCERNFSELRRKLGLNASNICYMHNSLKILCLSQNYTTWHMNFKQDLENVSYSNEQSTIAILPSRFILLAQFYSDS
ncbi:MAG: hypothetical protein EZS28_018881 [Streblomastix strix]|uniref:Uncharacterized protein n=1 Tax=Streblomastix strix TaxID=222440 RepID=A0A5J4VTF4_9EUKA|nr:MAG: hypothetical protein EZS28_018881 [Streblomastix strix]